MTLLVVDDLIIADITITVSFLIVIFSMAMLVIFFQKRKRQSLMRIEDLKLKSEQMKNQFQQELLKTQIEIQEQTLKTISQEIHDNVGQVLSLAKLNLNTIPQNEDPKIQHTKELVGKAITDLRNLSRSMYGDQLNSLGLTKSIGNELIVVKQSGQFLTELEIIGEPYKLADKKEIVIFRMVQEAINNIIKHAKAAKISIKMVYNEKFFQLSVVDDGKGFNVNNLRSGEQGMGLRSMQNRAELIGGSFKILSSPGLGTTISVEVLDAKEKI